MSWDSFNIDNTTVQVFGGLKYQIVERMQTYDQIKFRIRGPNI